ncbi:DNA glycosylase [Astrocystis sublimbata]|nr:DNA glycosylase [Astrocystis sublimbata]
MPSLRILEWRKLPLSLTELCIDTTLRCGQSFRWQKIDDEWNCVLRGRLLTLKQDESALHYKTTWPKAGSVPLNGTGGTDALQKDDDTEALLTHYFNLEYDLAALYNQWSESDPNFRLKAPKFAGIRILHQDAWETLVSFICSSNNHISRISSMVNKLCVYYGPLIGHVGDQPFHDFPPPHALTGKNVESHLRELGFGYRAKYIVDTANLVACGKPQGWLESLANPENLEYAPASIAAREEPITYRDAHEELLQLAGVGPKVADCVCLMGLGWSESVPVDTHVWQIAQRDYRFGKTKTKTFSKAMYHSVGDHFRQIWGPYAGWAQSVLFTANLKSFAEQAAADPKTVEIKVEVKEEITTELLPRTRKRRTTARVEQVKTENDETSEVKTNSRKRRKARG